MCIGDDSTSSTTSEAEIDTRLREALDMEDPDILIDLRHQNTNGSDKYETFWQKCLTFLNECTAVHERRHGETVYMARALSVRDLVDQVSKMCPEGTPIPSNQWVRLQFCPKNPRTKAASQFRKRLPIKMVVQKRQFHQEHIDSHYCAAIYRYLREYAVMFRDMSVFACMDDKHRIKVGEPGVPVAAAERGRRVLVSLSDTFKVCDHDFTKFSLIPSVTLLLDIPSSIEGSWYDGQVYVGFKDAIYEPSSCLRHSAELHDLLLTELGSKSILFLYTDGGPDHRTTYISTQLALIALFLNLNLDYLCAARTAPHHSWRNPVERMMSILNLGLQSVGMMRSRMSDAAEVAIKNCNTTALVRKAAEPFQEEIRKSLEPTVTLLNDVVHRLELKGKKFRTFDSLSAEEIQEFWDVLNVVEPLLSTTDKRKKDITDKSNLQSFYNHCCRTRTYFFSIKKCGKDDCTICKPLRMSKERFKEVKHLPDPLIENDQHYFKFEDAYMKDTTEKDRPSLQTQSTRKKSLPFTPSQQHVKNIGLMLQCEECDLWRLLYSRRKLSIKEKEELQRVFDDVSYICGGTIQELDLPEKFSCVFVREHNCFEPVEKLYYSAGYDPICIHCASEDATELIETDHHYPICLTCRKEKEPIAKRKKK